MEYESSTSIDRLIDNIGSEESIKLLTQALPVILARRSAILEALGNNDLETAIKQAHKTSGSIRMYGSSNLETLLREVIALPSGKAIRKGLADDLKSEFDAAIHEIRERLNLD